RTAAVNDESYRMLLVLRRKCAACRTHFSFSRRIGQLSRVSTEAGTVHLLAACRAADTANTRTAVVIVDLAATLNAPSRILTTASAATGTRPHNSPTRPRNARPAAAGRPQPGPVEARLLDLGVTSPVSYAAHPASTASVSRSLPTPPPTTLSSAYLHTRPTSLRLRALQG
ncbi:MAG TPA: hypothetical protein VIJ82_22780, partial [Streptosporangiaceae bacterium]